MTIIKLTKVDPDHLSFKAIYFSHMHFTFNTCQGPVDALINYESGQGFLAELLTPMVEQGELEKTVYEKIMYEAAASFNHDSEEHVQDVKQKS